jgi:hypothetical protein
VTTGFSPNNNNQQLAQLGFIVVQIGNRGGQSAALERVPQLRLLQPPRLRAGRQEGRHRAARGAAPFIDLDRVGISATPVAAS